MALANCGIQLRWEAQVAAAAVRAAHLDYERKTTHPAQSIVRSQKAPRDGLAQGGSALFEREGEPAHQRFLSGELIIDRRKVCQGADGPIHCSLVRGPLLRLEPAFRRNNGLENCTGVGCAHDRHHGVLVCEHLRELV